MSAFDTWVAAARNVSIGDVLATRGIRLTAGSRNEPHGPCPLCRAGDDRFYIRVKQQRFACRQCLPSGGDVIDLVERLHNVGFIEACQILTGMPAPGRAGNGKAVGGAQAIVTAIFPYEEEAGDPLFVVERVEYLRGDGGRVLKDGKVKKAFRQKRPNPAKPGKWLYNVDGVRVIPYRLPELIEAVAQQRTICILEGERKVDALIAIGVAATCNAMGAGHWRPEHAAFLRGADVVVLPDNDNAGFRHLHAVGASLVGIATRVRVLILPHLPTKGDVLDWLRAGGTREQFDALVTDAPAWAPPAEADEQSGDQKAKAQADEQRLIDELARLSGLAYDRRRNEAARDLGVRRSSIDREVEARREQREHEAGPPPLFGHWVVEPWPEPVDTDALLLQIERRLQRHIVFSSDQAKVCALWILFAWVHENATHSPKLLITSAEADSGKSTLCALIGFLTPRALSCVQITEATLFRSIEHWLPTLIIDEADTILINNEPLRAVVNAGWTRGTLVPRCIGDDHIPHAFPTFCPQVVGMKGKRLSHTTLTRCIVIELKRKRSDEKLVHFNHLDDNELVTLRQQALRWSLDNAEVLRNAKPEMPEQFYNRLGDNFRMLFSVADLAGGEWPEQARGAAGRLSGVEDVTSRNVRLLAAIKDVFDGTYELTDDSEPARAPVDAIRSEDLVERLTADKTAEWVDWSGGKPISQTQLARALNSFQIGPDRVRIDGKQRRGYARAWFEDAWKRYLRTGNPL